MTAAVLLDTNALLWLVSGTDKLSATARDQFADPDIALFVSAASAWEIAIKTHVGRLDGQSLLSAWDNTLAQMGVAEIAMNSSDGITAGGLSWRHNDPFDRMIVAQALLRGLAIATSDTVMIEGAFTAVIDTRA